MTKPLVIPVFIPHAGCPHRCAFCNQHAFTEGAVGVPWPRRISAAMDRYQPEGRCGDRPVELAFFGGNFLGLDPSLVSMLLDTARGYVAAGRVDGIRFSTRPDTIMAEGLGLLSGYPVHTVEIGAQSMDDAVLKKSGRGHSAGDTVSAVRMLKTTGYRVILQMMVGLPGDSDAVTLSTARRLARLLPDGVRIYPTVVLKDSVLATWFERGAYRPLSLEAAVNRAKSAASVFRSRNIPIIRLGLQATSDLDDGAVRLAGPYHPAFGHLVYAAAYLDRVLSELSEIGPATSAGIAIRVHPADIPRMRGLRNQTLTGLSQRCRPGTISIQPDGDIAREWLRVNDRPAVPVWPATP